MQEDEFDDIHFDDAGDLQQDEDWLDTESSVLDEDDLSLEGTDDLENLDLDIELDWEADEDLTFLEED